MAPRNVRVAPAPASERPADKPYSRIYASQLHPGVVNIIDQVRKTYDQETIIGLADSIASLGMLQLPLIAALTTRAKADAYVSYFNLALGSQTQAAELVSDLETGYFYVVIFGHRRTLANLILFERGCSDCQESDSQDHARNCIERHVNLSPDGMEVRIVVDPDPRAALDMQLTENTAEPLTIDVIADRLRRRWTIAKRLEPKLTMAAFGRSINQRPAFVRSALAFCELPAEVVTATKKKAISFTSAIELSRLQAAGFSDEDIRRHMKVIVSEQKRSADVRTYIAAVIKDRIDPEAVSLFGDELANYGLNEKLVRTVHKAAADAAAADVRSLQSVQRAIENGILPDVDVGSSPAVKRSLAIGDDLRRLIPSR